MINNVVLVGRLVRDIEVKKTSSNTSYCRFNLACDRVKTKNNPNPGADFISCTAWRQTADFLGQYAKKGAIVAVTGRITTGSYDGKDGKVYTTEVTCDNVRLVGGRKADGETTPAEAEPTEDAADLGLDVSDDDLPF